ncbi:NAD(P)/FAD-dependent oxidoreductase [Nocardiopsis kunsanensis]|uniref:NAD(P)/FAD-dependent oxidoreductase n=1 Tax=Nocardiopsis kunsanensis TaxID=141693 RepID=UPI00034778CB|nr:NAD(P)/FAD-dependent oxidoreductase [Nocardiopsis kunsanensis]
MQTQSRTELFDTVIVGGGPAGLSAAVTLGRARRSVLVVDDGTPRNAPAEHAHAYLTREGAAPGEILDLGRAEAEGYGVRFRHGTAVRAEHEGEALTVVLGDGSAVRGRRLLVTTGLVDGLPDIDGLAEHWGSGVLHCPYCHGWEVRDQRIGVVASNPMAVHSALMWSQWSDDVTLFLHTAPDPTDEQYERLAARGVTVVEGRVRSVESADGRIRGLRLAEGYQFPVEAVVVGTAMNARSAVLESLGVATEPLEAAGEVFGSKVPVDAMSATSVPGVYAAGNVADPSGQIVAAAAAGTRAGAGINADLVEAETAAAVSARAAV